MRVVFTGQTGIDKTANIESLVAFCHSRGSKIDAVFHVGDLMYEESAKTGHKLAMGKILDLPLDQLALLRRLAFLRIGDETAQMANVFINTHAVFRWDYQLFQAFDIAETEAVNPDMVITLIDNVEEIKARLERMMDEGAIPKDTRYTLKDLMVWREEEILASEILASVLKVPCYVLGVGLTLR